MIYWIDKGRLNAILVQVASPDLSLLRIDKHIPIKSVALCAGSGASVLNNVDAGE